MSSSRNHLDAEAGREIVFCHNCREEWFRDAHPTLQCPNCESEITEIVDAENDPRAVPPDFENSGSFGLDREDSDPGEENIENHIPPGPGGDRFFVRRRILPGWSQAADRGPPPDDGVAIVQRFTDMMMNDFRFAHPERPRGFFDSDRGSPTPRFQRTTIRAGPGFRGGTVTIGFGPVVPRGDPNAEAQGPADFDGIFGNLMNNLPPPGRDEAHQQAGFRGTSPDGANGVPPQFFTTLQDLLATLLNPGAAVHGDAVYTQEALDRIITQLMEANPQSNAAPPASEEALNNLEKKKLDEKMIGSDEKVECTICIDELKRDDEVTVLPCKHFFHPECVTMWLKEHNTCPICRTPIEKREDEPQTYNNPLGPGTSGPSDAEPNSQGGPQESQPPGGFFGNPFRSEVVWDSRAGPSPTSPQPRVSRTPQQNEERLNAIRNLRELGTFSRQSSSSQQFRRNSHSPPSRESGSASAVRARSPSLSRDLDHEMSHESVRDATRNHWAASRASTRPVGASRQNSDTNGQDHGQQDGNASAGGSVTSSHGNPFSWIRDRMTRDRGSGPGADGGRRRS